MTRTEYANSLVDGAKHYNAHAVRYDFVGQQETHFNNNSFVSSLIVAKGGQSGLSDVCKLANQMDSGPVNVHGQRSALDDPAMSERVRIDEHENTAIAPGFANAGTAIEFSTLCEAKRLRFRRYTDLVSAHYVPSGPDA